MNIVNHLKNLSNSRWYWLFYIAGSVSLLAEALYFQFVHEELPCVMCIQVRLLLSLLILVSVVAVLFHGNRTINLASHLSAVLVFAGLTERSYMLLGTERGFVFADCGLVWVCQPGLRSKTGCRGCTVSRPPVVIHRKLSLVLPWPRR